MRYLRELHATLKEEKSGKVAAYIPELAKADPDGFAIVLATVDGKTYTVGDAGQAFTIQSISKAFVYGYALAEYGREATLAKVGVEPSGDAFNAIVFDEDGNRPFNPMVNSGAIATAALVKGAGVAERISAVEDLFGRLAGRRLAVNEAVFHSEKATGHRNRAIAWMMLNAGMLDRSPDEALDVYFAQCSVEVTCRDLALMAATLANAGTQPLTGERVLPADSVRDVISVMSSCGMYNYAGQWSFEIGLPAKSGVGGGIIAVVPGQMGIAVFSPPLDRLGNSVRGIAACKAISRDFGLHVFSARPDAGSVIRREVGGDAVQSKRLRSPEERRVLDANGGRIRLIELQGDLYFGSTERLIRRIEALKDQVDWIICDFQHVHDADAAAANLLARASEANQRAPRLLAASLPRQPSLSPFVKHLQAQDGAGLFPDADAALQWCEDRMVSHLARSRGGPIALADLAIFSGLARKDIHLIEGLVSALISEPGTVILREGAPVRMLFFIASGTVGVWLRAANHPGASKDRRVATLGPGLPFGEMALFDGGISSAEIVAEERVVSYGIGVEDLKEFGREHPHIMLTVLTNVTRELSERLRHANTEIRSLQE